MSASSTFTLTQALRIAAGLFAGILGGLVTRLVVEVSGLPAHYATIAFWAVVVGGTYKGWAAARRSMVNGR